MKLKKLFSRIKKLIKSGLVSDKLTCVVCGADVFSDEYFCVKCLESLPYNNGYICNKCGRNVAENYPVCIECKADMPKPGQPDPTKKEKYKDAVIPSDAEIEALRRKAKAELPVKEG